MSRVRVVLALLVGLLAGCLAPQAPDSGVEGVATLGPTCPVQRDPPDPACADKPFQGNLTATSADGQREVARFATGPDGRFRVALAPGEYAIRNAQDPNGLPRCSSEGTFVVRAGAWTRADVACDTGIR